MGQLEGRVAIVTGGGKGIGRAVCERFAHEGARVVVATRSELPGREVVDAITADGGEALLEVVDVGDRAAVTALIERTAERFNAIDIIVHNAAPTSGGALGDLPDRELDAMIDVALKAAFWLTQDALPFLRRSPYGRVLITSSVAGNQTSFLGRTHYGAAKMGVTGFVRGAALELAPMGITVNALQPGLVMTPALTEFATPEQIEGLAASTIPMGRAASADEIAAAFLFLASDAAGYITGQAITIDGGATLGDISSAAGTT